MSATVQTLIEFSLLACCNNSPTPDFRQKARIVASNFGDISSFLKSSPEQLAGLKFVDGKEVGLTKGQIEFIRRVQTVGILNPKLSIQENFIKVLVEEFIQRQLKMIDALTIENLNCNPILIKSLHLTSSKEVMTYYVFQSISRSIVTSLGYLVQDLLLYSGKDVDDAKNEVSGKSTKWDLVKTKAGEVKAWIEVKSGPNDLDKAQILHYKKEIEMIENGVFLRV